MYRKKPGKRNNIIFEYADILKSNFIFGNGWMGFTKFHATKYVENPRL